MNMKKNVLITGAGNGLGRGLAIEFAKRGYQLILNDLNPDMLNKTVELLPDNSVITARDFDISKKEEVDSFIESLSPASDSS